MAEVEGRPQTLTSIASERRKKAMIRPDQRMNWKAMADEAFHRAWLHQAPRGLWKGFWALIREDHRFWGMAGYFLHQFCEQAKEAKRNLTAHLPGPSRMWTAPILHLGHLSRWCADRSIRLAQAENNPPAP